MRENRPDHSSRSFCYITDTATGLLLLATCERAKGEVVNVGNTQEVTILELAQRIKENAKCKSTIEFRPLPKDDPKRRCPDTSKLEKVVGWKPNVSFEERLERTIKWFVSKKRSSQIEQEKRKNMHEPPDPNYAESLFPLQFSSVQITRSRKHLALSTLNIQG